MDYLALQSWWNYLSAAAIASAVCNLHSVHESGSCGVELVTTTLPQLVTTPCWISWRLPHSNLCWCPPSIECAKEQLFERLPAVQATALRLTILEGLSLRAAAPQLQISPMAVQRAQKKALSALRQQLVGAG
jgi:hypothetical protein